MDRSLHSRLAGLRAEIAARASRRLEDARIDAELRALLAAYADVVRGSRAQRKVHPAGDWESLFLLIGLAERERGAGAVPEAIALDAAAALELYGLSITLFDAVQDDELYPPFTGATGPAVAINAALVLFLLAGDGLAALDVAAPMREAIRASHLEHSLIAGSAQHHDVAGRRPNDVADALHRAQGKTSLHAMICEVAAILAGASPERVAGYRRIGERTARIRQMANDLRGVFGADESVDLARGKWTLPLAVLAAHAAPSEVARLEDAVVARDLAAVRALLISTGAVHRVAGLMDRAIREIASDAAALALRGGPMDLFFAFVETFAAQLYKRAPGAGAASVAP